RAHAGVRRGERALLERRVREQVGGGHAHLQPSFRQRLLEVGDDAVPLACRGGDGYQVVVVQADPVGADLGQLAKDVVRVHLLPCWFTERVTAWVPNRPQAEREAVSGLRLVAVGHDSSSARFVMSSALTRRPWCFVESPRYPQNSPAPGLGLLARSSRRMGGTPYAWLHACAAHAL